MRVRADSAGWTFEVISLDGSVGKVAWEEGPAIFRMRRYCWRVSAVPMTQPQERIKYVAREVDRYEEDAASATDLSTLEDMIAKANFLFDRIMRLDIQVNRYVLLQGGRDDSFLQDEMRSLLARWLAVSLQVGVERESHHVDGLDKLMENLTQAKSILTPDEEFFDVKALSNLRDDAIEAHRLGLTKPLSGNERH